MTENSATKIWRERVSRFLRDCEASSAGTEAERLREAAGILLCPPLELSAFPRAGLDAADLARLIERGAFESAALATIGQRTAFMLSRSGDGRCLATIADNGVEATAEGASLTLALLAAYAGALLAGTECSVLMPDKHMANPPRHYH